MVGVVGYIVAFQTLEAPAGVVARITTFLPPVAPFVVPIRGVLSGITWWEYGLSVVVMVLAVHGMVRLAGRVYAGGILHIGARLRLREAWRRREV
jgi:ABC-2 type transport system permease protein